MIARTALPPERSMMRRSVPQATAPHGVSPRHGRHWLFVICALPWRGEGRQPCASAAAMPAANPHVIPAIASHRWSLHCARVARRCTHTSSVSVCVACTGHRKARHSKCTAYLQPYDTSFSCPVGCLHGCLHVAEVHAFVGETETVEPHRLVQSIRNKLLLER